VFLWLAALKSILTKHVLIHSRGWKGKETKCSFCECHEILDHLFSNVLWLEIYGVLSNVPFVYLVILMVLMILDDGFGISW
jgi:hypothetical protein